MKMYVKIALIPVLVALMTGCMSTSMIREHGYDPDRARENRVGKVQSFVDTCNDYRSRNHTKGVVDQSYVRGGMDERSYWLDSKCGTTWEAQPVTGNSSVKGARPVEGGAQ